MYFSLTSNVRDCVIVYMNFVVCRVRFYFAFVCVSEICNKHYMIKVIQGYTGLLRSMVEYNSSVWSPSLYGPDEMEELVQSIKLLRECKNMPCAERLKYMNLPTLRFRRCSQR